MYPSRNESMRGILLLFLLLIIATIVGAQPANDNCTAAISIDDLINDCSNISAFSNVGATPSADQPACFGQFQNDVWFTFRSTGSNLNAQVIGNQVLYPGGTARTPHMTIYKGNCGDLEQISCVTNRPGLSENLTNVFLSDLEIGVQYYMRVSAQPGTFQICLSSFDTKPDPNSDCGTGVVLCDKSTFVVPFLAGAGRDDDEALASCLDINGPSETNSAWFKWTADTSGTLSFTLFPNNPDDDLDFAVFEMDNLDDCNNKRILRCMASGENVGEPFANWDECTGPTGIGLTNDGLEDFVEIAGCQPGNDNFIDPIDMVGGVSYALVVNNFSQSGEGFRIEFGGTGTFAGPEVDLEIQDDGIPGCEIDSLTVLGNASFGSVPIIRYDWNTADALNGDNISGPGPHQLSFNTTGPKSIALTVETENGCLVTDIITGRIQLSERMIESTIADETCPSAEDGSIAVDDVLGTILSYEWSNGSNNQNQVDLPPGDYQLQTTDVNGCVDAYDYTINSAGQIAIAASLTDPTCGGGTNGVIDLSITGPGTTYEVDWSDGRGFVNETSLTGAISDIYNIQVRSSDGCTADTTVFLNEVTTNPQFSVTDVSCFGFDDGSVVVVPDGLAPWTFEWEEQNDFDETLENRTAGFYVVNIVDGADCRGFYAVEIRQPDSVTIEQEVFDISCNGLSDGRIETSIGGGTPGYTLTWSNGENTESITSLPAGNYDLLVTDANGCTSTTQYEIVEPPELTTSLLSVENNDCNGDATGVILFESNGGVEPYQYQLSSGNQSDTSVFENLLAGSYIVRTIDANGCVDSFETAITEPDPIVISLSGDDTVRLGQLASVYANYTSPGGVQLLDWNPPPDSLAICGDLCDSILVFPVRTGTVSIRLEDPNGCEETADFLITVLIDRPVYIPNAISANGDGMNDHLGVYSNLAGLRARKVLIFDRWGEKVYEGQNQALNKEGVGWDGTFEGQKLNPGIFVYQIEVEFIDGFVEVYSGEVNLLN